MKHSFSSIANSSNLDRFDYDKSCLTELYNLRDFKTGFVYNINDDSCIYLSSYIKEVTGYGAEEYVTMGLNTLKKIIHPEDFPNIICEMINFIRTERNKNINKVKGYSNSYAFRIKHANGHWQKVTIYNLKLIQIKYDIPDTLVGYIRHDNVSGEMQSDRMNLLSLREHEVLKMVSAGDTTKIIAKKLYISETTVITHRKNIVRKFKVRNTAELIKEAVKYKVIE